MEDGKDEPQAERPASARALGEERTFSTSVAGVQWETGQEWDQRCRQGPCEIGPSKP